MNYKFKFTAKQKIVEIINLIILLSMIGYLIVNWNNIGDTVAIHYNVLGQIDSWGDKNFIITLPAIALIVNSMTISTHFVPQLLNIPVKLTEDNYERVYELTRSLTNFIKTMVNISLLYISIMSANAKPLGAWYLPIFLTLILLSLIIYFVKARKA